MFNVVAEDLQVATYQATGSSRSEQLYSSRGGQGIALGAYFDRYLVNSIDTEAGTFSYMNLVLVKEKKINLYRVRPQVFFRTSPVFTLTDRDPGSEAQSLISIPLFAKYLGMNSVRDLYYQRLMIKMKEGATPGDAEKVVREILASQTEDVQKALVIKKDKAELYKDVDLTINLLFTAIIFITMFLCFFQLSTSMTANLFEQSKEIGVLRSLGFSKLRIILLYSYESFILVISSSVLGVIVGTLAAFTMVLQFTQFSGMPTQFFFPWIQLIGIFLASFICAMVSTIGPTKSIVKHRIASILRM
jgi:ABC-type antimicrobial peptide transport system permease subunit